MNNHNPTDVGIAAAPGRAEQSEQMALPVESPDRAAQTAAQWGLAALLTSGVSLLMAPLLVFIDRALALNQFTVVWWDTPSRVAACVLLIAAVFVLGPLSVFSLVFALMGLGWARARRLPVVLHMPGVVLGVVTLGCWLVAAVAVFFTIPSVWGRLDERSSLNADVRRSSVSAGITNESGLSASARTPSWLRPGARADPEGDEGLPWCPRAGRVV
jgi:hypothetical protein